MQLASKSSSPTWWQWEGIWLAILRHPFLHTCPRIPPLLGLTCCSRSSSAGKPCTHCVHVGMMAGVLPTHPSGPPGPASPGISNMGIFSGSVHDLVSSAVPQDKGPLGQGGV